MEDISKLKIEDILNWMIQNSEDQGAIIKINRASFLLTDKKVDYNDTYADKKLTDNKPVNDRF